MARRQVYVTFALVMIINRFKKIAGGIVIAISITMPFMAMSQTSILRPEIQSTAKKVYSAKKKQSRPVVNRAPRPSLESVYADIETRYDWHGNASDERIPVSNNNLFGYVDLNGKEVIPLIYEGASDFENGEATVMLNDLYGTINRDGAMVIPIKYEEIMSPTYNFYAVKKDGKWGYVDRHGIDLSGIKYDLVFPFASNLGIVRNGEKYGAIDKAGNEIIPVVFDEIEIDSVGAPKLVALHGRRAEIDSTLNIDFSMLYDEVHPYGELGDPETALVKVNGLYGLVNKKMKELTAIRYSEIFPFKDGLARVHASEGYNYVKPDGSLLTSVPYAKAADFFGEYALVTKGSKEGIIDREGTFQPVEFFKGIGKIKRSGKLAVITEGGVLVNDLLYDEIMPFVEDRAIVLRSGNYGFIDTDGFEVVKPIYNEVTDYENGVARVRLHDLWGLVAKSGEYLVAPKYQKMEPFVNDLSRVEKSRLFGYIGRDGLEKVHASYDSISSFEDSGLARTLKNGKYGLVDKNGHEVVISTYDTMGPVSDNLYAVSLDGKYGYMDTTGKIVIKLKYDEALPFVNGLAPVRKKDRWGAIDSTGHTVIPIKYDPIENLSEDTITVTKNGEPTIYNRLGKKL